MLDFIKSAVLQEYFDLLAQKPEYADAIFLHSEENRLYINGAPVDVRITRRQTLDENNLYKYVYDFTDKNGEVVTIDDAQIPAIEDLKVTFRDFENMKDYPYSNGLMSITDKILVRSLADMIGVSYAYDYYATVNHIKNKVADHDYDTMTDVDVFQDENGDWRYAFEAFEYSAVDGAGDTQTYTYPAGTRLVDAETVRVKDIRVIRRPKDTVIFDGGNRPQEQEMPVAVGGLKAGTTVDELEQLSVSEVVARVLFQEVHPEKIKDAAAYLKYKETYAPDGLVSVGQRYPEVDDFDVIFIPETWQMFTNVDHKPVGEPIPLGVLESVEYWMNDLQHPHSGGHRHHESDDLYNLIEEAEAYADHTGRFQVEYKDKTEYYAIIHYTAGAQLREIYGKDSYIDADGNEVEIPVSEDGTIRTNNLKYGDDNKVVDEETEEVLFSDPIYYGWLLASNASETSNESMWVKRHEEPAEYKGVDTQELSSFYTNSNTAGMYLKWPSELLDGDKLFVYVPVQFELDKVLGAHDFVCEDYSIKLGSAIVNKTEETVDETTGETIITELDEPLVVIIENEHGKECEYNKYEISRMPGITSVMITLKEKETEDEQP